MLQVCASDCLPASWRHRVPWLERDVLGISLSRNPRYQQAAPVRLTIDFDALRARHRILPLSADYVFDLARIRRGERQADPAQRYDRAARCDPYMPSTHPFEQDRADEEFVVGSIVGVSRYLRRVELRPDASPALRVAIRDYAAAHQPASVVDASPLASLP